MLDTLPSEGKVSQEQKLRDRIAELEANLSVAAERDRALSAEVDDLRSMMCRRRCVESQIALGDAPLRKDLSPRECVALLIGNLSGISEMAPDENVQRALDYLAKHWFQISGGLRASKPGS